MHLAVLLAACALLCGFVQCEHEIEHKQQQPTTPTSSTQQTPTTDKAKAAPQLENSTRVARLIKVLQDPKSLASNRYNAAVQRVIARADNLPAAGIPYRRAPAAAPHNKVRPQIVRRVQNGSPAINGAPPRFAYEAPKGAFFPSKGTVPFNAGKLSVYRPPFAYAHSQSQSQSLSHPNALSSHVPAAHHQQQQQHHEEHNFKASPHFNGKAIVRPLLDPRDPNYRQQILQLQQYASNRPHQAVQQYPIPQQQQKQKQQQQIASYHPSLVQSQKQTDNQAPIFHYETVRPHEEPVLHPHVKHVQPPPISSGYAVYENNELANENPYAHPHAYYAPTPRAEESLQQYPSAQQSSAETAVAQEAEDYIKFMNSNDYFLPKREPNYKHFDTEQNKRREQQREQQQQQSTLQQSPLQQSYTHYPQTHHHQQQQQPYQHIQKIQYGKPYSSDSTNAASAAATNFLNQPIKVSQLFYQDDPVPTIVRGSYQAGNNLFVVKSDGNKAVKHIVQPPTTLSPTYSKPNRYNTQRSHTTEPLRFEFTERDAVHSAYTNSPPPRVENYEHSRYKSAGVIDTSSTLGLPTSTTAIFNTATSSSVDDPEDEEDVHSASSDYYGRVAIRKSSTGNVATVSTSPAPVEQKDTEDYCERICSNVQDNDEEIVCGSDGYMYTSEAQMECYATCLHIDVTVQSKGSCNTR